MYFVISQRNIECRHAHFLVFSAIFCAHLDAVSISGSCKYNSEMPNPEDGTAPSISITIIICCVFVFHSFFSPRFGRTAPDEHWPYGIILCLLLSSLLSITCISIYQSSYFACSWGGETFVFIKLYPVVVSMAVGEFYGRRLSVATVIKRSHVGECEIRPVSLEMNIFGFKLWNCFVFPRNEIAGQPRIFLNDVKQEKHDTATFCSSNKFITGLVTSLLLSPQTQKLQQNVLLKSQFSFLQSFFGRSKKKLVSEVPHQSLS